MPRPSTPLLSPDRIRSVALDIIESYDGELFLEASPLGGAEFRIRFPLI